MVKEHFASIFKNITDEGIIKDKIGMDIHEMIGETKNKVGHSGSSPLSVGLTKFNSQLSTTITPRSL